MGTSVRRFRKLYILGNIFSSFSLEQATYLGIAIAVHQRIFLNPENIESTDLKDQIPVAAASTPLGCRRNRWNNSGGCIVGAGGTGLLRSRNKRHALNLGLFSALLIRDATVGAVPLETCYK